MTSDTALPVELASKIVDELFDDLRDRRFLKWLFKSEEGVIGDFPSLRSLDLSVQQEIRDEWATITIRALSATRTDLWEPIETAPKDRMVMLCLHPHPGYIDTPMKVGGWWENKWNLFGASWNPTHWQPLPAPPITTEGE